MGAYALHAALTEGGCCLLLLTLSGFQSLVSAIAGIRTRDIHGHNASTKGARRADFTIKYFVFRIKKREDGEASHLSLKAKGFASRAINYIGALGATIP